MGSLEQSHMEYQKLFTVQTATLRLKTVTPALMIYQILFFFHPSPLSIIHIIVTLQIDWTRRWVSYLRYCLCPTGCAVGLVFPCIWWPFCVVISDVCAIEAEWPLCSSSWCSAITSSLPVGTCCLTPKQCERHQKNSCLTRCILNDNNIYWFLMTLEKCSWAPGLQARLNMVSVNILFSHAWSPHTHKMC